MSVAHLGEGQSNMAEISVRVVTVDGKQVAIVDRIERDDDRVVSKLETLNKNGEWQKSLLYTPMPETLLEVRMA